MFVHTEIGEFPLSTLRPSSSQLYNEASDVWYLCRDNQEGTTGSSHFRDNDNIELPGKWTVEQGTVSCQGSVTVQSVWLTTISWRQKFIKGFLWIGTRSWSRHSRQSANIHNDIANVESSKERVKPNRATRLCGSPRSTAYWKGVTQFSFSISPYASLPCTRTCDTGCFCCSIGRSHKSSAFNRYPVTPLISFYGTFALNMAVIPLARKLFLAHRRNKLSELVPANKQVRR